MPDVNVRARQRDLVAVDELRNVDPQNQRHTRAGAAVSGIVADVGAVQFLIDEVRSFREAGRSEGFAGRLSKQWDAAGERKTRHGRCPEQPEGVPPVYGGGYFCEFHT
jgi:hypothetical protein